jgi:hypothetical protein
MTARHRHDVAIDNPNVDQVDSGGSRSEMLPGSGGVDIAAELDQVPDVSVSHFFVDADTSDPAIAEEAVGLDPTVSTPESIMRFLTLPTITAKAPRRRFIDPVVDFTKSVMLTSDIYVRAVEQLQEKKEEAARANLRKETKMRGKKRNGGSS